MQLLKRFWLARPAYAVGLACVLLVAAGWALTFERVDYEYRSTVEEVTRRNENLAFAYEQHTIRTLEFVDQAVRFVRYEHLEEGERLQLDRVFRENWLDSPLILYAAIVDADGKVIKSTRRQIGRLDVADRDYFKAHRAEPRDQLLIGAPTGARVDGRPSVHASRRISGPDGSFRGVALLGIAPERLADFQQLIDLGESGVIQLVGLDGLARVRRHGGVTTFGDHMGESQLLALAAQAPSGNFTTRGRTDGVTRLQSYRRLADFPFVVGIGVAAEEALAGHARHASMLYASAAAATLLLVLLGAGVASFYERQQRAADTLRESEARFRSLTELSSDFYWETDAEHRLTQRGSGGKPSTVGAFERGFQIGRRRWEMPYLSPDEAGWRAHRALLDAHLPFRGFEISRRGDDGSERFISLSGDPMFGAAGEFKGYRGVGTDITQRKRAEQALVRQAEALGAVSASEALASGDLEAFARLVTERAAEATGVARANVWLFNEDASELRCIDLYEAPSGRHSAGARLSEDQFANELHALKSARYVNADDPLTDPRTAGYVGSYVKPLGITSMLDAVVQIAGRNLGLLCLEHVGQAHRWSADEIAFACQLADKLAVALANRGRRQAETRLERQTSYDALTELPNRTLFYDRLAQTLNQARRHGWHVGVLFVDLDRFKNVNDTLGHATGDRLLREAGARLAACVRAGDTVARIGGDEFAVIAADLAQAQDAALVAGKILEALARPFVIDGQEIFLSGSVGIAAYPVDGADAVALMKNADVAMSRAKELGRNNYQFYAAPMNARAMEELLLLNDLRRALERGEFRLHFQPKASLRSGRACGFEALLRWERPGHGLVPPGKFIPLLEESGLIVPVGEWVIRAACAQLRDWREAGLEPLPVAVNLAAKQFAQRDIAAVVDAALLEHGVPPHLLEIEITESDAMQDAERVLATLGELSARGVGIAIDDFGTGYSSLAYLKRFPVETLKLDRSFVNGLPGDANDVSIALAVITMAHSLGFKVVAEGVEKAAQRDFLAQNGCDQMQGYLFAKPMPAGECAKLLAVAPVRAVAGAD